jgi:DNA-binding IclR family transcriptional regulator
MIRDIERKVLAILRNFTAVQRRLPTFRELSVKTGKRENEIKFILNKLQESGYIEWDGIYALSVVIIKGWVDQPSTSNNNTFIGKI